MQKGRDAKAELAAQKTDLMSADPLAILRRVVNKLSPVQRIAGLRWYQDFMMSVLEKEAAD
jgi:hypothetical protein